MATKEELQKDHDEFLKVMEECAALRCTKLLAYGRCYRDHGVLGIVIRMHDKISRINQYFKNKKAKQLIDESDEQLRDSLVDIVNYAVMGLMVLKK